MDTMSGLLFIRHAETDMAGTFCGHSDPVVNARGKQQIHDLIVRLAHETIDEIYSSDLRRSVTTAESLAQAFAAPFTQKPSLREIYFGDWEGLDWTEIEQLDPPYAKQWIEQFPNLPAPGGELFVHFEARVFDEMRRLLLLAENSSIAVVTHRGVIRIALRELHGCTDQEAWEQTNSHCCWFACNSTDERLKTTPFTGDR
jgi:alpha-ribazole phosphatase/probable phosphoglycerate mutase